MHLKFDLLHVHVTIQRRTLAPLRYYGDLWQRRPTHEEDDVGVARLAQNADFILEGLQLCLGGVSDL